jgi:hypothetical protein
MGMDPRKMAGNSGPPMIPGVVPGVARPAAGGDEADKAKGPLGHFTRTEFVILFVWVEPTPSDQYLPPGEASGSGGSSSSGGGVGRGSGVMPAIPLGGR